MDEIKTACNQVACPTMQNMAGRGSHPQGKRMNIEQIFSVNAIGLREKTHG